MKKILSILFLFFLLPGTIHAENYSIIDMLHQKMEYKAKYGAWCDLTLIEKNPTSVKYIIKDIKPLNCNKVALKDIAKKEGLIYNDIDTFYLSPLFLNTYKNAKTKKRQ